MITTKIHFREVCEDEQGVRDGEEQPRYMIKVAQPRHARKREIRLEHPDIILFELMLRQSHHLSAQCARVHL